MAKMYPEKPREFDPKSREGYMFQALEQLPDSYRIFHSFTIVSVVDSTVYESETDFVIFNPEKGLLCIEAKAGMVKCENGIWKYSDGNPMQHGGPFNQASQNKWKLKKSIEQRGMGYVLEHCKLMHAVWFPSIGKEYLKNMAIPSEADKKLILTKDSIDNIEEAIANIFALELPNKIQTNMSNRESTLLLNKVLAPSFNLISLSEIEREHKRLVFKEMLKEQVALLNYLEEQNNAVINGLAGTGKTVMAIEKAKRHALDGEKVLFLCYNAGLKNHLQEVYGYENISYYTIDGLACSLCNTPEPEYCLFKETLEEMYFNGTFPYQHIIIDEGQDFGQKKIDESDIIELLKGIAIDDESKKGTFYLFYDKNQLIQGNKIPEYISESDCKLTLYRNCRNTENIAITSMRLLGTEKKPKLNVGTIVGDLPEMYVEKSKEKQIEVLDGQIDKNLELGYENIVILTCKTEKTSILTDMCSDGIYIYKSKHFVFTTCRKFKGLEADAIIMVDMNYELFNDLGDKIYYVGTSRARFRLSMIAELDEEECNLLIEKKGIRKRRNVFKALATAFNAKYIKTE